MTPDELATAGRALYGERWQTSLARDLHVSDRTMRRWLAGGSPIPERVEREVRAVLSERFNEIGGMIADHITPRERTIFHRHSAATFQFDEAGTWTPLMPAADIGNLHGFLRGSVVVPPEIDLTDPIADEAFAAEEGDIHR